MIARDIRLGKLTGRDQAFVAPPAVADAEQFQSIDKPGDGGFIVLRVEDKGENPGRAEKIPLPDGMFGMIGQGGVKNPFNTLLPRITSYNVCYTKLLRSTYFNVQGP